MLREMVAAGAAACVMEASSHALALRRVELPAFPRRDLHQPDPRSSRLPPRHGGVLPRQAAVVRAAAGGELRRLESRRSPRRRVCRCRAALGDLRHRRARRRAAGAAVVLARRARLRGADAARHAVTALAAGRAAERLQRPRRRRDGDGARPAVQRDRTGHRPARTRAGPLSARVRAGRRRPRRRRLRPHRRRPQEPARDRAPARVGAGDHGVRLRRRSRYDQASADGCGRVAAERPRCHHLRQPALRGSRSASSTRSSAAS